MSLWRRMLRLSLVLVFLSAAIAAVVFEELADIASTKPASYRQSDKHSNHTHNKQDWTDQVAVATDWLTERKEWLNVISTAFIAFFTFTLWKATERLGDLAKLQASDMQQLLAAARDNANAGTSQADAMRQLHAATVEQHGVLQSQAKALRASASIAERTLVGLERPYIFLSAIDADLVDIEGRTDLRVIYTMSNYGRIPGLLNTIQFIYETSPNLLLANPDYSEKDSNSVLLFGEAIPIAHNAEDTRRVIIENVLSGADPRFFLYGRITYRDPPGNKFTMGFGLRKIRQGPLSAMHGYGGTTYNYNRPENWEDEATPDI